MVGSQSKSHSVRALTIVLLLASSLFALAKPEDVLTADITQGKVGKLSQNGVVPHKNMGGVMHGVEDRRNCTLRLHSLLFCARGILIPSDFRHSLS
jgi:hypothetical protein